MRDVQVVATETSNGVAIAFTTTGDVEGLRMRVRHMAEMRNRMTGAGGMGGMHGGQGMGGMHGGQMGMKGGMQGGEMRMQMVPARASVEDIDGGARLVLTPVEPAQLAMLREQTAAHAAMMQARRCPMMQATPMAGPSQPPAPQPGGDHEQHHPAGT